MKDKFSLRQYIICIILFFFGIGMAIYLNASEAALYFQIPFYGLSFLCFNLIIYHLIHRSKESVAKNVCITTHGKKHAIIELINNFLEKHCILIFIIFCIATVSFFLLRMFDIISFHNAIGFYIVRIQFTFLVFFITHYAHDNSVFNYFPELKVPDIKDVGSSTESMQLKYALDVIVPLSNCYNLFKKIKSKFSEGVEFKYICLIVLVYANTAFLDKGSPFYNRFLSALVTYPVLIFGYFLMKFLYNKTKLHRQFEIFDAKEINRFIYYKDDKYNLSEADYRNNEILKTYSIFLDRVVDSFVFRFAIQKIVIIFAILIFFNFYCNM